MNTCRNFTARTDNGDQMFAAAKAALRCVAIGRKNYLFAGSDAGGRRERWYENVDILRMATSVNGELLALSGPPQSRQWCRINGGKPRRTVIEHAGEH